jgi:serine protease
VLGAVAVVAPTRAQQPMLPFDLHVSADQARGLIAAWNGESQWMPGELLVKFRAGAAPGARAAALSVLRRTDPAASHWIGDVLVLRTPGEPDAAIAAAVLTRQPEVEWAQPNYVRRLRTTPNDPSFGRQWNFNQIEVPRAWDVNPGASPAVIVAVIDTGATSFNGAIVGRLWTGAAFESVSMPVHVSPDFAEARLVPGRDFVLGGPVFDSHSHGTHVAGTILQETNNGVALAGIAYAAKLMPLKACLGYWDMQLLQGAHDIPGFVDPEIGGLCPDSAVTAALRYAADNGAQIINLSAGGTATVPAQQQAIEYAVDKGVFVSIAVGNAFEFGNPIEYPGAYAAHIDGAVSVGAVGRSRRRAAYSGTGPHVELVAPGGDSDDGGVDGLVYQVAPLLSDFLPGTVLRPRFDRYAETPFQGTSMAAPHVAGVAALLYSQGITKPAAIEAALERFATDLGPAGRDNEYGYGLINARASLRGMGLAK